MILRFKTHERRLAFVTRVEQSQTKRGLRFRLTKARPHIVVTVKSEEDRAWLHKEVRRFGEAFDDVCFEPLETPNLLVRSRSKHRDALKE